MSDYNSSLPVRTEANGDVASKIVDGTITSRVLTVNADGSINVTDNGSSITVDATNLDIRDLTHASDSVRIGDGTDLALVTAAGELNVLASAQPGVDIGDVTVNNAAGAAAVNIQDGGNSITIDNSTLSVVGGGTEATALRVTIANDSTGVLSIDDNGGSLTVDGSVSATNFPTTVDTNFGTVGANTLRSAAQIGNATGAASFGAGATGAQTLRVEANQGEANAVADAWPMLLTDGTDTLAVNTDGSINVVIADSTPGTPINDYNTSAAVAAAATSNHDYTVTVAKTFYLNQIEASGSGKMKIEVRIETAAASGVFNTKWVQFNSTAETNFSIHIENPIAVPAGAIVRVIRTNRDNQAQDVYSTISGYELP